MRSNHNITGFTDRLDATSFPTKRILLDNGVFNEGYRIDSLDLWGRDGSEPAMQGLILTTDPDFYSKYDTSNPLGADGPGVIGWGYVNSANEPFSWIKPDHIIFNDLFIVNVDPNATPEEANYMIKLKKVKVAGKNALLHMVKNRAQGVGS